MTLNYLKRAAVPVIVGALAGPAFSVSVSAETAFESSDEMQPEPTALPAITVEADIENVLPEPYAGGQVGSGANLGLLGNTHYQDAPISINSYTSQTIEDQQARSVADVLANDPSVRAGSARSNINEDFTVRGLPVPSSDIAFDGMFGVTPYFRTPIEMAERIEVLRGTSALFNGMSPSGSVGGTINIVPKRANEALTRLTLEHISESIFGAHVDLARRFGDKEVFGARFNGVVRSGDGTVDYQKGEDQLAALALDFQGEQLRGTLDLINQQQQIDGMVRQYFAGPGVTELPEAPDGNVNYPGGWTELDMEDTSAKLRVEYDFSDAITGYAAAGMRDSNMDAIAGNPTIIDNQGNYDFSGFSAAWQVQEVQSSSFELGINMSFATGNISHKMNIGASKLQQDQDIFFDVSSLAPVGPGNIYQSFEGPDYSTAGLTKNVVPFKELTLTSYAIADTVGFMEDRLLLTLGLRQQQVEEDNFSPFTGAPTAESYDEAELTKALGVVYKTSEEISLYASFVEGLSPGPDAPLGTPSAAIEPFVSEQIELGAKADWGSLGGSVALYELTNPGGEFVGVTFVGNEQVLRGLELSVFGKPVESVRILGGASFTDSELTVTSVDANKGNEAIGAPKVQLNVSGEWDTPFLQGFTLTGRAIHTGKAYVNAANTLEADAWTRIDLGARYRTEAGNTPLTIRATVENVFNENYWGVATAGYLHVGDARTVLLSATVDF